MSGLLDVPQIDEKLARTASTAIMIARGMAFSALLLVALDVYIYFTAPQRFPTPESLRLINLMTTIALGYTLVGIFLSEMLWRSKLRVAAAENVAEAALGAFIVRTAVREGAALFAGVVALLAAQGGVLRLYPAYWASLVPVALFFSYLWAHWPTGPRLKAEIAEIVVG